jgi:hypothetical protein
MEKNKHTEKIIQKILESQEFKASENIKQLFVYLYNCYLKDTTPKESQIALDVFSRESSFNSADDPIVRVSAHNLRKKLTNYYNNEGKQDNIKVEIPKGHYHLDFIEDKRSFFPNPSKNQIKVLNILIVVILSIVNLWLIIENHKLKNPAISKITKSPIWADFFSNNMSNLITLGDFLIIREVRRQISSEAFVRVPKINEYEEFDEYKKQYSDLFRPIEIFRRHSYLAEYFAWPLLNLIPLFYFEQRPLDLQLVSTLTADDLNSNNIIFIGYYKTLGLLKKYFSLSTLSLIDHTTLLNKAIQSDSAKYLRFSGSIEGYNTDYALLAKFVGPKGNNIILFCAFRLPGTLNIVESITKKEQLIEIEEALKKEFGQIPKSFEVVLEISGYKRKSINSKIIMCNKIESPELIWAQ